MTPENPNTPNPRRLTLTPLNYKLMAIAGAVIVIGFLLMLGKGTSINEFNPDIFSVRRVVVGPSIAFLGYIFMGVAIMWRRGKKSDA